eukprot:COSAG01_NODE_23175_length_825_cov_1.619835_1_plen_185_part_10
MLCCAARWAVCWAPRGTADVVRGSSTVQLKGTAESVSAAKEAITQLVAEHSQVAEMIIAAEHVGAVIGKGGESIRRLQAQSGAKVDVLGVRGEADEHVRTAHSWRDPPRATSAQRQISVPDTTCVAARLLVGTPGDQAAAGVSAGGGADSAHRDAAPRGHGRAARDGAGGAETDSRGGGGGGGGS